MTLALQEFLSNFKDNHASAFADLKSKFAIDAKRHPKYPNLVLFKYSQIDSPFSEKIVQESRGIILDSNNNWKIISRAFDKFKEYV